MRSGRIFAGILFLLSATAIRAQQTAPPPPQAPPDQVKQTPEQQQQPAVIAVPVLPQKNNGKIQKSVVRITTPAVEPNYEAPWNHWLVDETVEAVKEAVWAFTIHETWKRQFLPIFNFTAFNGQPAFDKLFKPKLHDPLIAYLKTL